MVSATTLASRVHALVGRVLYDRLGILLDGLLDAIYPKCCPGCGESLFANGDNGGWCSTCRDSILTLLPPYCERCGQPTLVEAIGADSPVLLGKAGTSITCHRCATRPPNFDRARASGEFGGPLENALVALKYRGNLAVLPALASLITPSEILEPRPEDVDLVVPVPLHPSRLRERGYDQASLIAREVARLWHKPISLRALRRTKKTRPQVGLSREERAVNVRGAFKPGSEKSLVGPGVRVLLVDDVMTTGATASEAALVLKEAGAARVEVLTIARAV